MKQRKLLQSGRGLDTPWAVGLLAVGLVLGLALIVGLAVAAYVWFRSRQAKLMARLANPTSTATEDALTGGSDGTQSSKGPGTAKPSTMSFMSLDDAVTDEAGTVKGDHLSRIVNELSGEIHSNRLQSVRRNMTLATQQGGEETVKLESLLGEGTFGKVYRAVWRGSIVAVKCMVMPASMTGTERRQKMAIMETAISSVLSHPNIVQTYTYMVQPVKMGSLPLSLPGSKTPNGSSILVPNPTSSSKASANSVHSWEVWLVLEYCDLDSLRAALDRGALAGVISKRRSTQTGWSAAQTEANKGNQNPAVHAEAGLLSNSSLPFLSQSVPGLQHTGQRQYGFILITAQEIARAMVHLHSENILHSDLKASNVLLKTEFIDGRGFTAKIADFGLSMKMDPSATHVSGMYQGTLTHMAPEVLMAGRLSKASDVYSFGILLWEIYTGLHAFHGVPKALMGHEITRNNLRPRFPPGTPPEYQALAGMCWDADASARPAFPDILGKLNAMRAAYEQGLTPLSPELLQPLPPPDSEREYMPSASTQATDLGSAWTEGSVQDSRANAASTAFQQLTHAAAAQVALTGSQLTPPDAMSPLQVNVALQGQGHAAGAAGPAAVLQTQSAGLRMMPPALETVTEGLEDSVALGVHRQS